MAESIRSFEGNLEMIRDCMREQPEAANKDMVKEIYQEMQAQAAQLESLANADEGIEHIAKIMELMDVFRNLGDEKKAWESGRSAPGSRAGSHQGSSHHSHHSHSHQGERPAFELGGVGSDFPSPGPSHAAHSEFDEPHRGVSEDSRGRRKDKKNKRRNSDPANNDVFGTSDFENPTSGGWGESGGFGDFPAPAQKHGGWPDTIGETEGADDQWGAIPGATGWGKEVQPEWGAPPSQANFSPSFDDRPPTTSFGHDKHESGGFGSNDFGGTGFPATTPSFAAPQFEKRPSDTGNGGFFSDSSGHHHRETASSHRDRHGGSSPSSLHSNPPLKLEMNMRRPYSEIQHDIMRFERKFSDSIARATGIESRRIRITAVRPDRTGY